MATAAEQLHGSTTDAFGRTTSSEAAQIVPLVRLLTSVWQVPQVVRLGLALDDGRVTVWAILDHDDPDVEGAISEAEHAYLSRTRDHPFELHVVPRSDVAMEMLPPFETILER